MAVKMCYRRQYDNVSWSWTVKFCHSGKNTLRKGFCWSTMEKSCFLDFHFVGSEKNRCVLQLDVCSVWRPWTNTVRNVDWVANKNIGSEPTWFSVVQPKKHPKKAEVLLLKLSPWVLFKNKLFCFIYLVKNIQRHIPHNILRKGPLL